ncbi:metallophosphoesterase family protein [Agrobacterium vitis]|uniref:metallophosphoesterase family protein n=1 Tax=Agrobacterium vitis TaxID=373 RepID=UPI0015747035|nr:metallophosphoesterase family protein [Agrobacterium vitis]NSZ53712.1 metallophosphoesterase family protein [Agrobacterium vitis]NTA32471.1 metallophosphoesterase family protein [Agrobacterium vitis]
MRFAAIADIHGNCLALEAVLADIATQGIGYDHVVNLGDCFSGPLEAGRTGDLLLLLDLVTVRGNHDRYLIEQERAAMHSSDAEAYDQLSPRHLQWLQRLPVTAVWREEVFLCHATPKIDDLYWLESVSPEGLVHLKARAEIEALAEGVGQELILCAHSHLPRAVRLTDRRLIVNPGSVGCPAYDDDVPFYHRVEAGTPLASYAILEKGEAGWTVTFRQVPYRHLEMARLAADRGRDDWASGLESGWLA